MFTRPQFTDITEMWICTSDWDGNHSPKVRSTFYAPTQLCSKPLSSKQQ